MRLSRVAGLGAIAAAIGTGGMVLLPLPSSPAGGGAQVTGDTAVLEVVVGDSVPLLARYTDSSFIARTRSTDTTIATMVGKYLVARSVGSVLIMTFPAALVGVAQPSGSPTNPVGGAVAPPGGVNPTPALPGGVVAVVPQVPQLLLRVNVRTQREATNMLVSEVCANVDSAYFMMHEPLTSNLPRIHEYHDCQRLIEGGRYSAVVGIFASSNVDSTHAPLDSTGHLAAIIVNFIGNKPPTTYRSLNLTPGTSCLIIRSVRGRREAALIPQSPAARRPDGSTVYGDCPDNLKWSDVPRAARGQLQVREQRGFDLQNRRIAPSVGRWDWDSLRKHNYIGIKCGSETWCEIGPSGFTPSTAATTPAGNPIFKGYYDEQYLAEDTLASKPSTVWGTILPGSDATDKAQMENRDPAKWYEHATVRLVETHRNQSPAYGRYNAVFAAAPTMGPIGRSSRGGMGNTKVPTYPQAPAAVVNYPRVSIAARAPNVDANAPLPTHSNYQLQPIDTAAVWLGYKGMMRDMTLQKVRFMWHPGQAKVPTVRWRWMANDEGIWSYCEPDGCCEYTFK